MLLSGVGAEAGLSPSVRFWGLGSARPLPAGAEQPRRVWKAYRPKEDVGGNFRPEKEENPGWLYFVASQHRGGGSGPGRGAAPLTRPSF